MPAVDRRRFPRHPLRQTVKWQDGRGGRYQCGRTCDVSHGGMLLDVAEPVTLSPGQALRIALPPRDAAIVADASMTDARVVRIHRAADGWRMAVAYNQPDEVTPRCGRPVVTT
jgi:hypothetical protein